MDTLTIGTDIFEPSAKIQVCFLPTIRSSSCILLILTTIPLHPVSLSTVTGTLLTYPADRSMLKDEFFWQDDDIVIGDEDTLESTIQSVGIVITKQTFCFGDPKSWTALETLLNDVLDLHSGAMCPQCVRTYIICNTYALFLE